MYKDIYKLTFRDLQLLQLTEKFGSLTRAATTMRMSPSGASRALTHIREILGDSCFVFTRGVPVPTAFFNRIRPVISDILVSTENLKSVYFEPQSCTRTFI
ncbi:MAG: LysR family transcriptional regulator, partial [Klebsiella quasipneumoniae]|nr:LysR family transcriptional regulator [Klebsiella quasipneumoniae]